MTKEEYAIFPGQIKINNCTYFGLDYELTDFVNHLAEQNQKYKEVIDRAVEHLETKRIREKAIVDVDVLEGILKEVE